MPGGVTFISSGCTARRCATTPSIRKPRSPWITSIRSRECGGSGVRPEALVAAYGERGIMIRQGSYHTPTFGDRFVKVSTSVPQAWVEEFVDLLPAMVDRARGLNTDTPLF